MKKLGHLILVLCFSLQFLCYAQEKPLLPTAFPLIPVKAIKVAVMKDVPSFRINTNGPYEIFNEKGLIEQGKKLQGTIESAPNGILITGHIYALSRFKVRAAAKVIQINARQYNDNLEIIKTRTGKLIVVNEVNIEDYLKGVLPLEVSASWSIESLKAQAVVSRTFAVFKAIEKQNEDYALADTVHSQVYGGSTFQHKRSDDAVDATRGQVMIFDDMIFPAYFHASVGGRTAAASDIWSSIEPNSVFKSVKCNFCKGRKHYQWFSRVSIKEVEHLMQKNGYPAKNLKNVELIDQDISGRARKVRMTYPTASVVISAESFRDFLGYSRMKSLKATVYKTKDGFLQFKGFGWGHGIGFCQWGARTQSDQGIPYVQILSFYYPGIQIVTY